MVLCGCRSERVVDSKDMEKLPFNLPPRAPPICHCSDFWAPNWNMWSKTSCLDTETKESKSGRPGKSNACCGIWVGGVWLGQTSHTSFSQPQVAGAQEGGGSCKEIRTAL